jgi:hypothetical protein
VLGGTGGDDETSSADVTAEPPLTTDDTTGATDPAPAEPDLQAVPPGPLPDTYGSVPDLDELVDLCRDGSAADCDQLYMDSPVGSAYEVFGATCGARAVLGFAGRCANEFDAELNASAGACDRGDMAACDVLYLDSRVGSLYEAFGARCGMRRDQPLNGSCEATLSP